MSCSILERCDFHSKGLFSVGNKVFIYLLAIKFQLLLWHIFCLRSDTDCEISNISFTLINCPYQIHENLRDTHISTSNLYIFVSYIFLKCRRQKVKLKGKFLVEVY